MSDEADIIEEAIGGIKLTDADIERRRRERQPVELADAQRALLNKGAETVARYLRQLKQFNTTQLFRLLRTCLIRRRVVMRSGGLSLSDGVLEIRKRQKAKTARRRGRHGWPSLSPMRGQSAALKKEAVGMVAEETGYSDKTVREAVSWYRKVQRAEAKWHRKKLHREHDV